MPKCEVYHTSVARNRGNESDNLDAVFVDQDACEMGVCDGMSSQQQSQLASHRATIVMGTPAARFLRKHSNPDAMKHGLKRLFDLIAIEIERLSIIRDIRVSIGTTCVFAKLWLPESGASPLVSHAHIGDSRLYRRRGDSLECCTVDHNAIMGHILCLPGTFDEVLQRQRVIDGFASASELREFLTRCGVRPDAVERLILNRDALDQMIGNRPQDRVPARVDHLVVEVDDEYFAVSDGVTKNVAPDRLQELACSELSLGAKCDLIVQEALDNGDKATDASLWSMPDDTTIVGMRVLA